MTVLLWTDCDWSCKKYNYHQGKKILKKTPPVLLCLILCIQKRNSSHSCTFCVWSCHLYFIAVRVLKGEKNRLIWWSCKLIFSTEHFPKEVIAYLWFCEQFSLIVDCRILNFGSLKEHFGVKTTLGLLLDGKERTCFLETKTTSWSLKNSFEWEPIMCL